MNVELRASFSEAAGVWGNKARQDVDVESSKLLRASPTTARDGEYLVYVQYVRV